MQCVLQGKPDCLSVSHDGASSVQETSQLLRRYRLAVGGVCQAICQYRAEHRRAECAAEVAGENV